MSFEKLIEAINNLFESFWKFVFVVLPFVFLLGWIIIQMAGCAPLWGG